MSVVRMGRVEDPTAGSAVHRALRIAVLLIVAVVLQSALFTGLTIAGVAPQLVFVVAVLLAHLRGEEVGMVAAFTGGLLVDLLMPTGLLGLSAAVYTSICYVVGRSSRHVLPRSLTAPVVVVALASLAAESMYALASVLLGAIWIDLGSTVRIVVLVTVYNTLLGPLVLPVVSRTAGDRPAGWWHR